LEKCELVIENKIADHSSTFMKYDLKPKCEIYVKRGNELFLLFKRMVGNTFGIIVDPSKHVGDVKHMIEKFQNLKVNDITIKHNSIALTDDVLISSLGVSDGAIFDLSVKTSNFVL